MKWVLILISNKPTSTNLWHNSSCMWNSSILIEEWRNISILIGYNIGIMKNQQNPDFNMARVRANLKLNSQLNQAQLEVLNHSTLMTSLKVYIQRMCQVKPVQGLNISQRQWGQWFPGSEKDCKLQQSKFTIRLNKNGEEHMLLHCTLWWKEKKRIMFVYTHAAALHPYGRNTFWCTFIEVFPSLRPLIFPCL